MRTLYKEERVDEHELRMRNRRPKPKVETKTFSVVLHFVLSI
jgi:hypothetical protein